RAHTEDTSSQWPREIKRRRTGSARECAAAIRATGERMALCASRGTGSGALCHDDGSLVGIGPVSASGAARRVGLVGAMDNIVADCCGLRAVEHRCKRGHAALLQRAVEHDTVPSVHGDEGGATQIRGHAAGHDRFAVANHAELIVQSLAGSYRCWASGVRWRSDYQLRFRWQGRELILR